MSEENLSEEVREVAARMGNGGCPRLLAESCPKQIRQGHRRTGGPRRACPREVGRDQLCLPFLRAARSTICPLLPPSRRSRKKRLLLAHRLPSTLRAAQYLILNPTRISRGLAPSPPTSPPPNLKLPRPFRPVPLRVQSNDPKWIRKTRLPNF